MYKYLGTLIIILSFTACVPIANDYYSEIANDPVKSREFEKELLIKINYLENHPFEINDTTMSYNQEILSYIMVANLKITITGLDVVPDKSNEHFGIYFRTYLNGLAKEAFLSKEARRNNYLQHFASIKGMVKVYKLMKSINPDASNEVLDEFVFEEINNNLDQYIESYLKENLTEGA